MDGILKNPDVFTEEYIPPEVYGREEEIRRMQLFIQRQSGNLAILGKTGTGKTVMMKWLIRENDIPHVIINGHTDFGLKGLTSELLEYFNIQYSKKDTIERRRIKLKKKEWHEHLFIIIDDGHQIKLYNLCKIIGLLDDFPVSTILIAQDPNLMQQLRKKCKATINKFSPEKVYVSPYKAGVLNQILLSRCRKGLKPDAYDQYGISWLGALATRKNGDARLAIKALQHAINNAIYKGKEKVRAEEIKEGAKSVICEDRVDMVKTLSMNEKILLYCILKQSGTYQQIRKEYRNKVYELGGRPLDNSNIHRNLNRVFESGLIDKDNIHGSTKYFPAMSEEEQEIIKQKLEGELS